VPQFYQLLDRSPASRLGSKNDVEDLKEHAFFSDINWKKIHKKQYTPSFKPAVKDDLDTRNFDKEFTNEKVRDTVADKRNSRLMGGDGAFKGFTYDPNGDGGSALADAGKAGEMPIIAEL